MNLDHIFLDLALTSTDLKKGYVSGIAVVRTDARGVIRMVDGVKAAYSERIEIPGESDENARPFAHAVKAMRDLVLGASFDPQYVVVSHGAQLDRDFMRKAWASADEDRSDREVFGERRTWIDMKQAAWPLAYCDMVSSLELASIASMFGFSNSAPDTCTGDCELLVRTYWAMMKRYRVALAGEEAVRGAIGDPLAAVFGKVGSLLGV